jgi:arylsulfatase A-like enzyme
MLGYGAVADWYVEQQRFQAATLDSTYLTLWLFSSPKILALAIDRYPVEYPRVLADAGYNTSSFGKDHFGWNQTSDSGIAHGFQKTQVRHREGCSLGRISGCCSTPPHPLSKLYDGLGSWSPKAEHSWKGEYDDYDQWFSKVMPGKDPQVRKIERIAQHTSPNLLTLPLTHPPPPHAPFPPPTLQGHARWL